MPRIPIASSPHIRRIRIPVRVRLRVQGLETGGSCAPEPGYPAFISLLPLSRFLCLDKTRMPRRQIQMGNERDFYRLAAAAAAATAA